MATTQLENRARIITPRHSRQNEIVAILLFALGLLLTLCLVSAAFYPNDPSWNSAGQAETHNLTGVIGANVAATLFQFVGLAAYLLPALLFATAWSRFRTRSVRAPLSRVVGLLMLVFAVSALLSISNLKPLFDKTVPPGGMAGTLIARGLASGLNTVGATILLVAIAATGVLVTTNFSFISLYERLIDALSIRLAFFHSIPERFKAWRAARREQALLRKEAKQAAKLELEAGRQALRQSPALSPSDRIAEFMREAEQSAVPQAIVNRGESAGAAVTQRAAAAGAGAQPGSVVEISSRRPGAGSTLIEDDDEDIEEMVKGVSVVRKRADEPVTGKLPFDAD